jgi:hypothetical protein
MDEESRKGGNSRAGDYKGEQKASTEPVDGGLCDIEEMRGGGRDGGEGQPLLLG